MLSPPSFFIPRGDNFSRSNAMPIGRGERDWPIRILVIHLTYCTITSHLTWHLKVVASGIFKLQSTVLHMLPALGIENLPKFEVLTMA
jgi:hypothetical protein